MKLEWSDSWQESVSWFKARQVAGLPCHKRMGGFDYGGVSPAVIGSLLFCPKTFFPQLKLWHWSLTPA